MAADENPVGILARGGRPVSVRGQKKEQDIVAAAARIFNEKGYAAASIRDIADAVGLLKGSLYYYVRSKEDLLYKIIVAVHDGAKMNMNRAADTEGSALDRVRTLVRGHFGRFDPSFITIRVFYVDFKHLSAGRQARLLEERDRYEHFLSDLITAGQEEGCFAPDLDPHAASIAILTMLNAFYLSYRPDGPLEMSEIALEYERLIVRGLLRSPDYRDDRDDEALPDGQLSTGGRMHGRAAQAKRTPRSSTVRQPASAPSKPPRPRTSAGTRSKSR